MPSKDFNKTFNVKHLSDAMSGAAATLWKRNWPSWPPTHHPKSVESAIRPLVLRKAWTKLPRTCLISMPIFGKDGCLPKGGMENMFSNGLTDGAMQILGLWELWLSQNTPMMDSIGSSFLRQPRFRITSLSWFSSSEKTAVSKLMINGDCKSLPNLWSQNIPFEAYKWSISDLNVIYGFICDLYGYHDVIVVTSLWTYCNTPQWIPLPKLPLKNLLDQVSSVPRWPKWWPPRPVLSVAMVSYDVFMCSCRVVNS